MFCNFPSTVTIPHPPATYYIPNGYFNVLKNVFIEGRRFISEDRKEGDVYDTLHLGKQPLLLTCMDKTTIYNIVS